MSDPDPTHQYIDCIQAQALALENSGLSHEEIADKAVTQCESLATASAQAFVDDMPAEEIEFWRAAGRTPEMVLERQKEIGRQAGRQMAIGVLEARTNERKPG